MKAVVVFLVVVVVGIGCVQLVNWLVAEPPPHVFHVNTAKLDKPK
jgi:hypothetical protein